MILKTCTVVRFKRKSIFYLLGSSRTKSNCWKMERSRGSQGVLATKLHNMSKHFLRLSRSKGMLPNFWENSFKSFKRWSSNSLSWNWRSTQSFRANFSRISPRPAHITSLRKWIRISRLSGLLTIELTSWMQAKISTSLPILANGSMMGWKRGFPFSWALHVMASRTRSWPSGGSRVILVKILTVSTITAGREGTSDRTRKLRAIRCSNSFIKPNLLLEMALMQRMHSCCTRSHRSPLEKKQI